MGTGVTYEESISKVWKGFWLLGAVTIVEVIIALLGNGHLIHGFELSRLIMYPAMIGLSAFKAYFIVKEFMHMGYEVRDLAMSVLLPLLLLVWAIIAFLWEGTYWGSARQKVNDKNELKVPPTSSLNDAADPELYTGLL